MGGEKDSKLIFCFHLQGSPPRGRGKEADEAGGGDRSGITPAWAGKSCQSAAESAPGWDHPRVGGEKYLSAQHPERGRGSPPRGRGKGRPGSRARRPPGITPAWAGKSHAPRDPSEADRDHPRVGGEKVGSRMVAPQYPGSPPRGRGKVLGFFGVHRFYGITPAWAGKSSSLLCRGVPRRDHPRVGGEKTKKIP